MDVLSDAQRVAGQRQQPRLVHTVGAHHGLEPVAHARFHRGQLLFDHGRRRLRRREPRHFPQRQLTLDRLPDRRGIGRRRGVDEPEFHECLHVCLRDRFRADPCQHAVEELLR
jgi:hypothetical protein